LGPDRVEIGDLCGDEADQGGPDARGEVDLMEVSGGSGGRELGRLSPL
jgi:hypothetical protein